ncbi:efflux RND transporter periplasmic adaptor subunit [Roseiconus lacunae]|uniref:efflux RND transporter periplasmic adaptor subunit n=1 Tax=Roseiconus lacunae TaxID=2605694 RepID=UPI001E3BC14C|nr:efflux RND transporter periplasmic adaptor subunit [Roseiconus lacunae]MCD0458690.1 HlyD family secretion protein [Roseiconus lacunae]
MFLVLAGTPAAVPKDGLAESDVEVADCRVQFAHRQVLASEVDGVIEFRLDVGDDIRDGEIGVQLRDRAARARRDVARARANNRAAVIRAELAAKLAQEAYELAVHANQSTDAYPAAEIRRRMVAAQIAAVDVTLAESDLRILKLLEKQATAELESYQVRTAISGIVTRVLKQPGEGVARGEPILEVVSPQRVSIEGYVSLEQSKSLSQGMPITVQFSDSPDLYEGQLTFVDIAVQPASQQVRVRGELENKERRIREGATATMTINRRSEKQGKSPL